MKKRPDNFEPPYPSWELALPPETCYVQCQVALQLMNGKRDDLLFSRLANSLSLAEGLLHFERAGHVDPQGAYNDIAIAYWTCEDSMNDWLPRGISELAVNIREGRGFWYEALAVPRSRFEVSASMPIADWGLFRHFKVCEQRDHAYWGAMRDRIAEAEDDGLPGQLKKLEPVLPVEQSSEEIILPENTCMIRTVQGYSAASFKERGTYLEKLRPKYEKGVRYLDENPVKSRCLSARLLQDEKPARGRPDTETIAWFASLKDLENWVHNHHTHKAIYTAAQQHAVRFSPEMHLLLSHEVSVVPEGKGKAMYRGCHPGTGLKRFLR